MIHFFVHRPVATFMLYAAVILLGMVSLSRLRVSLFPDISFPRLTVLTIYSGAAPDEIETLVTRPIEEAVSGVNGVKKLRSRSEEGLSIVDVSFEWGSALDAATISVRQKVDIAKSILPQDAERPVILPFDPGSDPVIHLLARPRAIEPKKLRDHVERYVRPYLERIPGVASLTVTGGHRREIQVQADEYRLQALGISLDQLSQAVSASNFSYPAGNVKRGSREYTVRVMGEFNSTDDIRNVVLSTGENGAPVKLSQVARVWDGFAERRGATLHNGTEAVIVGIRKEPGKNTIETAQSIRGALTDINRRFAESLEFEIIQDQSVFVQNAVDNLALDALFGGLLAFLVLLVFLRDIRAALIVAVTLPVSVIATFVPMYVRGVSLNIMSLGGLSLGLGMLIDNSIVVVESILSERELQPGLGLRETAVAGTRKVAASVVASTLASAVVFVPILFVSGLAGEVFRDMALTVTLSSVSSFLCSLSLIPMLTTIEPSSGGFTARVFAYVDATLGPVFHVADMAVQALSVFYAQTISLALSRPLATSSVAVLLTLSGAALFLPVKKAIFPDTDQGIVSVEMDMPGGISVEEAASVHRKIHDFISDNRLAVHSLTEIGFEGGDLSSRVKGLRKASHAESVFYLPSGTSSADFIRILRPALERSVRADVRPRSKGDPLQELVRESNAMLSLSIEGQDREALRSAAERVHKEMANLGVPTGLQIVSTAVAADPEVRIELDRVRAAAFGLTPETIAGVVRSAVNGTVSTIFRDGDQEVAVRVLLRDDDKRRVDQLGALHVTSPAGNVRLAGLIRSTEGKSYPALLREDQRSLERLQFSFPASQQHTVRRALDEAAFRLARDLEGHGNTERRPEVRISEENQETIESLSNLLVAFGLSGILIYMLLAAQFESLLHPLTLAAAIPMMLLGVSAALLLTGHSLNITSATGMILLAGIVVNNALILYEYIQHTRHESGQADDLSALSETIQRAGLNRLRPILLTSLSSILGLLPMALGLGGADLQAPMAVVMIGGMTISSALTLVGFPTFFFLVEHARILGPERAWHALKGSGPGKV